MSKKLPQNVIDLWPEVFKDIELEVIPVEYLHAIQVNFTNNSSWIIELEGNNNSVDSVNETLYELMDEYADEIYNIDFQLDTHKVKYDIQKRTKYFLKKKK